MPEALDSNASSPTSEMDPDEDDAVSGTDGAADAADVLEYTCIASTSKAATEPQMNKSNGGADDSDRQVKGSELRL